MPFDLKKLQGATDHAGPLGKAIREERLDDAERLVRQQMGIPDPSVPVRRWVRFAATADMATKEPAAYDPTKCCGPGSRCWSDGTWIMWFRNRLEVAGLLDARAEGVPAEKFVTAVLHCFFIYLEETEEMLARLAHREPIKEADLPGQSKVFTTARKLVPIDRVAARVAPPPKRTDDAI